jgi:hypothetical protein
MVWWWEQIIQRPYERFKRKKKIFTDRIWTYQGWGRPPNSKKGTSTGTVGVLIAIKTVFFGLRLQSTIINWVFYVLKLEISIRK